MKPTWGGAVVVGMATYAILITPYATHAIHLVTSLFLALLVVNIPYSLLAVRGVSIKRIHPSRVREGEAFTVRVVLENTSRNGKLLLRVHDDSSIHVESSDLMVPALAGGGTETVTYRTRMECRGVYQLQSCRLTSSAPFGLVQVSRKIKVNSTLMVHPRTHTVSGGLSESRTGITQPAAPLSSRAGQGMGFYGIREYQPGDPARKIHWPSSMRLRKVVVKEFEDEVSQSSLIVLDTDQHCISGKGRESNLESAICVVASLSQAALKARQPVTLAWHDGRENRIRCDRFMGDTIPAMDELAGVGPALVPVANVLEAVHRSVSRRVRVVVVAMGASEKTLSAVQNLRAAGWTVSLIVVPGAAGRDAGMLARLRNELTKSGVPGLVLDPQVDLAVSLSRLHVQSTGRTV